MIILLYFKKVDKQKIIIKIKITCTGTGERSGPTRLPDAVSAWPRPWTWPKPLRTWPTGRGPKPLKTWPTSRGPKPLKTWPNGRSGNLWRLVPRDQSLWGLVPRGRSLWRLMLRGRGLRRLGRNRQRPHGFGRWLTRTVGIWPMAEPHYN